MYGSSLLIVYDSVSSEVRVKVLDFANAYLLKPNEECDDGVVLGLRTLIDVFGMLI